MKKCVVISLSILCSVALSSCGSVSGQKSVDSVMNTADRYYDDGSYVTGGDYSSTSITGDKADYSYSFSAAGNTDKSKQEMLNDYEKIQTFVDGAGGYIREVNNGYSFYELDDDSYLSDTKMRYKAIGTVRFSAEIDNSRIPEAVSLLEDICQENHFTVTNFTQHITNYKGYTIAEETEDWHETITQEELDRRLEYASLDVEISYRIPRAVPVKVFLTVKSAFTDFWDLAGGVIKFFLALSLGILVLFIQTALFYKAFRKMVYKHRKKHPEYYNAERNVVVRHADSIKLVEPDR